MAKLLRLTPEQYHQYAGVGFAFPIPVLSTPQVERFRQACDELEERLGGIPRTPEVRQMHLHFRWAYELATHPHVLDAVEDVLGTNLLVWATELFAKHPGDAGVSIRWHRDQPYIGFDPRHTVTAWIALSVSDTANGCMRVVPRTLENPDWLPEHQPQARTFNDEAIHAASVEVALRPGEMSLHDARVLHGSAANLSTEKRVGFVVRYMTPAAQGLNQNNQTRAILARGRDEYHHFQLVDPPVTDFSAEALNSMKHSAADHMESMIHNLRTRRS